MASSFVRPDSPYIHLRVKRADGTWGKINSGVRKDEPDARRKIKKKLAEENLREVTQPETVHDASRFETWVPSFLRRHYKHPLSLTRALNAWSALSAYLTEKDLHLPSQLTHNHGHDYVSWRQKPGPGMKARSKNTALTEIKILSVIMQECIRRDWATANPLLRLGIRRDAPRRKSEVTIEDQELIEAALKNEPQWMQDCWLIGMRQGCRLRETAVMLDDIDLTSMTIIFAAKGGKAHAAPLHPDLVPIVQRRRKERRERLVDMPALPSREWRRLFLSLGLGHLSFHCTRVTVVTRLARSGATMSQAMAYVGHASEPVHRIYQRLQPADVARLGDALNGPKARTSGFGDAMP